MKTTLIVFLSLWVAGFVFNVACALIGLSNPPDRIRQRELSRMLVLAPVWPLAILALMLGLILRAVDNIVTPNLRDLWDQVRGR